MCDKMYLCSVHKEQAKDEIMNSECWDTEDAGLRQVPTAAHWITRTGRKTKSTEVIDFS